MTSGPKTRVVRFSSRFLLIRSLGWSVVLGGSVALVLWPSWWDDLPVFQLVPEVARRGLGLYCLAVSGVVLSRILMIALRGRPAIEIGEMAASVRADALFRRRVISSDGSPMRLEVDPDPRFIQVGPAEPALRVPRSWLHPSDVAQYLVEG